MSVEEINAELAKLNKSQRASLRSRSYGALSSLKVEPVGCYTRVRFEQNGFRQVALIGSRGKIYQYDIWEAR